MISNYLPIYKIALEIQKLLSLAEVLKGAAATGSRPIDDARAYGVVLGRLDVLLERFGFTHTLALTKRVLERTHPKTYLEMYVELTNLNDSLMHELGAEGIVRVPPSRIAYYDQEHPFGNNVSAAFSLFLSMPGIRSPRRNRRPAERC